MLKYELRITINRLFGYFTYIHNWSVELFTTYIIGHYNPSVKIIDLVSHTTRVVCVNFIHKWRGTYSLLLTPATDSFEKLFLVILFTLRDFSRSRLRGNRQRNNICILFWCLAWGSNPGFMSHKPTHYLLDYGDFGYFIFYAICWFKFSTF